MNTKAINIQDDSVNKLFSIVSSERPVISKTIVEDEPIIEDEPTPTPTTNKPNATTTPVEVVEQITDEAADTTADTFIWLIDFLQQNIFKYFAKKKQKNKAISIAGEKGYNKLQQLTKELKSVRENKAAYTDKLEKEDKLLIELNDEINDFIDALEMDDKEKEMLKKPLKEMVKIKNVKVSPEMSLLIAALMIGSSRIGVLYSI